MGGALPRKDAAGQAKLLLCVHLRALVRQVQYVAETPGIRGDPLKR